MTTKRFATVEELKARGLALDLLTREVALQDLIKVRMFLDDRRAMERKLVGSHPMEAVGYCRAIADIRALLRMVA